MKLRSVRGTHDIYGEDIEKYNIIENKVSKIAELNSFNKLETPIFEFTDLFAKPLGEQSDVVLKEMYSFKDRNEEMLTLRPEYTTPMIRAAITNNLLNELPLKIFGLGPMFRRERPQKGRYRQFNQINFEIFGTNDFMADLELIIIGNEILKSLLPNSSFTLNLNTLGQKNNLNEYKIKLSNYFKDKKEKLSDESKEKIQTNPLRILDSKNENDILISNSAPTMQEFISLEEKNHFLEIKKGLDLLKIKYVENNKLVRGLDYYCSTVFEFKTSELGSQDTLLGGGRYDGLIGVLGGPDIPGIGWAAGIERISMLMKLNYNSLCKVHLAITDKKYNSHIQKIMNFLRKNNISFYWNYKYNIKKSLSKANSKKIEYVILIGENEFNNNYYSIRNLNTGKQSQLKESEIIKYLND
ncbi:histidine--tRNA ligase [Pelagibacteraceae bacterium]|nr:histidine--tRNA ligase [Pelagibacteraceae bacterium]